MKYKPGDVVVWGNGNRTANVVGYAADNQVKVADGTGVIGTVHEDAIRPASPAAGNGAMDVSRTRRAVECIRGISHDSAEAHSAEDFLYVEVLQAIADGVTNAQDLAIAALRVLDINFERNYA